MFKAIISIVIQYLIWGFVYNIEIKTKSFFIKILSALSLSDLLNRKSSEFLYNINNLATQFSGFVIYPSLKLASDTFIAIAIFIFLAYQNPLAFISLSYANFNHNVLYDKFFRSKLSKYGEILQYCKHKST